MTERTDDRGIPDGADRAGVDHGGIESGSHHGLSGTLAAEVGGEPEPDRATGRLGGVLHWIAVGELVVGALFVLAIFLLVLLQVAQRYLPGGGWVWTGELARFSLVWCTFVLAGYLMANDRHITLHVIDYVLPARALHVVKALANVIVAAICLGMLYEGYQLITDRSGQVTPAARIPLTWVYIIPFIGFMLTAVRATLATFAHPVQEPPMPGRDRNPLAEPRTVEGGSS